MKNEEARVHFIPTLKDGVFVTLCAPLVIKWIDVKYNGNLEDAFQIRRNVFINEQNVPEEEEFDEADLKSHHAVVYADGSPVATGRLFKSEKYWIIGRISVLKEHRGKQAGKLVVEKLLEKAYLIVIIVLIILIKHQKRIQCFLKIYQ